MEESKCCGAIGSDLKNPGHETITIEKTGNTCPMCETYAKEKASTPIAVMCCEGGCLRGEIARQAANLICHKLATDKTARICLGGAFTKDTGQRSLVRNAKELIALEGCFIECASRMMKGAIPGLTPRVIIADSLIEFDRNLFGIDQMTQDEIKTHALTVAEKVVREL
ncbi:MAG: putative zinc-binding protein [Deltaproteobacteria bacterium]|nr:putative zinc-binding protein [Deltaproteobacteria bacterium]